MSAITAGMAEAAPLSRLHVLSAPPVLGAVLLGLEDMAAGRPRAAQEVAVAQTRLRAQLGVDAGPDGPGVRVPVVDAHAG
jgi:hypothetical protein